MKNVRIHQTPGRFVVKVPLLLASEDVRETNGVLLPKHFHQLLHRPDVELPLFAFAIGILSGVKRTSLVAHVAQDVGENITRRIRKALVAT